jgi:hypothetical protein
MFNPNEPVTPKAVARWFGITPQAIHMWVQRELTWTDHNGEPRKLEPADYNGPRGGARYWISDLRQAEKAARSKTQRCRRRTLVDA